MGLENLGELNKLYNFQDTIILCEIFEFRSAYLQKILSLIQKSVIPLVLLVIVFIMTKAST